MTQRPTMQVIQGGRRVCSGCDILDALIELIDQMIPDLADDDPCRPKLAQLRLALVAQRRFQTPLPSSRPLGR